MTEVFPNYYKKFKCIADKCTHNCCIGWEIDIDDETMGLYNSLEGEIGDRIRKSIEGDVPHFILREGERCPFLNENGLCDIIRECGEDALCDICYLHPRFRNFYSSYTETGLGLCCEEAARIILSEEDKFFIPSPDDITEDEEEFIDIRQAVFDVLQDRSKTIKERFSELAEKTDLSFDINKLYELFKSLERLDDAWTEELEMLKCRPPEGRIFEDKDFQLYFEHLSVYFVFRHLSDALWSGDYISGIRFSLISCYIIGEIWEGYINKYGSISAEKILDIARMYSAEVEYSEENTERLMEY